MGTIKLLWQVNPFFSKLSSAVNGVFAGSINYRLYAFSVFCLFVTVSGYHIELADVVLNRKKNELIRNRKPFKVLNVKLFSYLLILTCKLCMYKPYSGVHKRGFSSAPPPPKKQMPLFLFFFNYKIKVIGR